MWTVALERYITREPMPKNNLRPSKKSIWKAHADGKTMNEANWAAAYNPNETIEDLYDRLEDFFVVAIVAKPSCTMDQMVDKALIAFQRTGLYATAILEWNAVDIMNQTWPEFKMHFTEVYDLRIHLGAGMAGTLGYHGVNNTTRADENSWSSINEGLMAQMQQVQLANNTSALAHTR